MPFRLAVLAVLLLALPGSAARAQQADFLLVNARIYTADDALPTATAMAVADGRVLALGDEAALQDAHPDAPLLDAGGRTVVPGFIDAHAHLTDLGSALMRADLVGSTSRADVLERLRVFAADLPPGAWLRGLGWDQNDWPIAEFPTAADLDVAFPDRPVWLERVDKHAIWANSAAMRALGAERIEYVSGLRGGRVLRDDAGRPTGIFIDAAMDTLELHLPMPTPAEADTAFARALDATRAAGLTGVHEAGVDLDVVERYRRFINDGRFPIRVYGMVDGRGEAFDHFCDSALIDYRGRLTIRAVKFYIDGALGSRGAALEDDYHDDPGNRGLLKTAPDDFARHAADAMRCGYQVATHAIGDRGNRVVLDGYAEALAATDGGPGRHRIEHAQVVGPDAVARFVELGLIASMQPTHATSDMPWAEKRVGAERIRRAYAWQTFIEAGVPVAFGSDFPVERVSPLLGFYAAVTRQDGGGRPEGGWYPDQRVSRQQALEGFTIGAAYAAFMEDEVGSLVPGKRADFVVLSRDIMTVPPEEILGTRVVATYLDGERVWGGW